MNSTIPAHEKVPAPIPDIRVLSWFAIYFAGSLPIILQGAGGGFWNLFAFPFVLGSIVFVPLTMFPAQFSQEIAPVVIVASWLIPYGIYIVHLTATMRARTRRQFDWLLLSLVALVLLNQLMTRAMGHVSG